MIVIPATHDDLTDLCGLLEILFAQEAEFRPDAELQRSGLLAVLENPDVGRVLVLKDEGMVIGMVALLFLPSTALGGRVAFLEDMIVHPEERGGGAGGKLLSAAIECAKECGCLRVTLLTDGTNEAAQRFYARHGFSTSGMMTMRLLLG